MEIKTPFTMVKMWIIDEDWSEADIASSMFLNLVSRVVNMELAFVESQEFKWIKW